MAKENLQDVGVSSIEANTERVQRRRGGAFDMLARVLRGVQDIQFKNKLIMRNRPGRKLNPNDPKRETGLVYFRNMFEVFFQETSEPEEGLNGVTIGREGDGGQRQTNLIQLNAKYNSTIGSAEGDNNGWVKIRATRDSENPASDRTGISVFDIGSRIVEWNGVTVWIAGDGENGGVVIGHLGDKSDSPATSGNPYILIDKDGIQLNNLPTSDVGLFAGTVYRDGTTLRVKT